MSNVRRDRQFDAYLDAEAPIEILGTQFAPSDVLANLEPAGYEALASDWRANRRSELLALAHHTLDDGVNRERFERMVDVVKSGNVVAFVGAGLSVPMGAPGWTALLEDVIAEINSTERRGDAQAAIADGAYEVVASILRDEYGRNGFEERVVRKVTPPDTAIVGPLEAVLELFDGPIVTTNLDRLIESSGEFDDVYLAPSQFPEKLVEFVALRRRILLKLHGDIDHPETWVLDKAEYDEVYGDPPHDGLPATRALRLLDERFNLVFFGCSLRTDRTMKVLSMVAADGRLPTHFAIVERMDSDEPDDRRRFLEDCGVFPIWYPEGEHDCVEALTVLLAESVFRPSASKLRGPTR